MRRSIRECRRAIVGDVLASARRISKTGAQRDAIPSHSDQSKLAVTESARWVAKFIKCQQVPDDAAVTMVEMRFKKHGLNPLRVQGRESREFAAALLPDEDLMTYSTAR